MHNNLIHNNCFLQIIGRRICILGASSSGKSTLAVQLGHRLSLPIMHLDLIYHHENTQWHKRPLENFISDHDQFIKNDQWIVEGNYSCCMASRFKRATTVIILKYNSLMNIYYYIKRTIFDKSQGAGRLPGTKDYISFKMIGLIFRHAFKRKYYQNLIAQYPHLNILIFKSRKQLNEYLNS